MFSNSFSKKHSESLYRCDRNLNTMLYGLKYVPGRTGGGGRFKCVISYCEIILHVHTYCIDVIRLTIYMYIVTYCINVNQTNCVLYCFHSNGFTTRSIRGWNNNLISTLYQCWYHNLLSTKFRPHIDVETAMLFQRWNHNVSTTFIFQPCFNIDVWPFYNIVVPAGKP